MNPTPELPSSDEPINQRAADWVVREERGLSPAEQDAYLQWLVSDRRHGEAVARLKTQWRRLDQLGQWRPEHSPQPNRDLLAPRPESWLRRLSGPVAWRPAMVLAACVLLIAVFWWMQPPATPAVAATPEPIATIEQLTLDDGSVIMLNRGAAVRVNYTVELRRIELVRGEAHFAVAKNAERPFVVGAGGVAVRAVGTAFSVRFAPGAVDVLVTEGQVRVSPPASSAAAGAVDLAAGERTSVALGETAGPPQIVPTTPEQVERVLAWQPRLLDFTSTPLVNIVAEFNRHNAPIHLAVADPSLARMEISASLRSDNVEGFIRLLGAGFGVRADREGDTIHLRKAR